MLEVGGVQYTNFTTARCELRLDSLSSTFSFGAVAPDGVTLPIKGGDPCKVYADGDLILTGFVEVISVSYDSQGHQITISGRDKTADLLDSTLGAVDDIRADGLALKKLIELIIAALGLTLTVIDEANPEPFNSAEDLATPEPGDNAFSFLEGYARKRQVLLTSNGEGNIVIAKNSGITSPGRVQHVIGAEDNNVMSSTYSFDTTGRFNSYKLSSNLTPVALNLAGDTDLASSVNQSGGTIDSEIRVGRQLVIIAEQPSSSGVCGDRAKWEADIRRARGLIYSAKVPGFRIGWDVDDLWQINRVYQIVDDFVGKVEPMLSNSVVFSIDVDSGRNTEIGFVGKNAYTLFLPPVETESDV